MELKEFNRNVRTIAKAGTKLDTLVHMTALGGMLLVEADGNATRMDQLLKVLPKGYRSEAFKIWVCAFSPVRWDKDGHVGLLKPTAKSFTPFNHNAAAAIPFWDFTQENTKITKLSLDAILAMLKREADKIAKANDKGEIIGDDGKVKYVVEGNVIDLKARIEQMRAVGAGANLKPAPIYIAAPEAQPDLPLQANG